MSELIVLGLIPGTQIQITFAAWLAIAVVLAVAWMIRLNNRTMAFQAWVIASSILVETQRRQF